MIGAREGERIINWDRKRIEEFGESDLLRKRSLGESENLKKRIIEKVRERELARD